MNASETDTDPSIEFRNQLKSTLNRLSNQYLCLLKAASSEAALSDLQIDPRAGGKMLTANEPPAPLASSTSLSALTTAVATQNICASVNQLLDLIRTLRLSITIMGEDRFEEEEIECLENYVAIEGLEKEACRIEEELLKIYHL